MTTEKSTEATASTDLAKRLFEFFGAGKPWHAYGLCYPPRAIDAAQDRFPEGNAEILALVQEEDRLVLQFTPQGLLIAGRHDPRAAHGTGHPLAEAGVETCEDLLFSNQLRVLPGSEATLLRLFFEHAEFRRDDDTAHACSHLALLWYRRSWAGCDAGRFDALLARRLFGRHHSLLEEADGKVRVGCNPIDMFGDDNRAAFFQIEWHIGSRPNGERFVRFRVEGSRDDSKATDRDLLASTICAGHSERETGGDDFEIMGYLNLAGLRRLCILFLLGSYAEAAARIIVCRLMLGVRGFKTH